ncbi:hypothetical protein [Winogradskyella sp. PG-2]|uniref:hypothetical protein n=1 Tax=Winogradskyella sp. PG-2 TaxID=754409 RepID=UPI00045879D6|nr:hypothetical protein [Winogradskyella sp. PG-2]BAO76708.1 hypothetical protein WPG_2478 [Winogradskyella sp. PG-2]
MKTIKVLALVLSSLGALQAQQAEVSLKHTSDLKMETEYSSNDEELSDILNFEGIDYMKIKFSGDELKGKSYKLAVKEIWDGKVKSETIVVDSKNSGIKQFETVNDSVLRIKVISRLTADNQLKMTFRFPRFGITKKYDAIKSDNYSLRNLAAESNLDIGYNEKFYILPYEREDGSKSWCEVGTAGADVEKWGDKFGIKHYLLFEMKFE